jgi:hypothetical protein
MDPQQQNPYSPQEKYFNVPVHDDTILRVP